MDTTITLTSVAAIIGILVLFIVLKKVVGLVFRLVMAAVLIGAVILGAYLWSRSSDSPPANTNRPQRTRRP